MIRLGKNNRLKVIKFVDFGLYLTDESLSIEILLPLKYIPQGTEVGEWLTVFVYNDSENRPIATTLEPIAEVGDFAYLQVVDVTEQGAFLDLGVAKDVFISFREQAQKMQKGQGYIVYLYMDEKTNRITGTSRWNRYINIDKPNFEEKNEVNLLIADRTDLGFKAIINNTYLGLLYYNEIFENLQTGDFKTGYVKKIREENKIDVALQQAGYKRISNSKNIILEKLEANNGVLNFGDKSSPEQIYEAFNLSKKAFKKMVGALYREELITVDDFEIRLQKND